MGLKALASDFDETIFFRYSDPQYRPEDLEAIRRFQAEGNLFGVCTGRSWQGITEAVTGRMELDFYILVSGALILDKNQNIIYKRTIPVNLAEEIALKYRKQVKMVYQANHTVYCYDHPLPMQILIKDVHEIGGDIYGLSFATESAQRAEEIAAEVTAQYGEKLIAFPNVRNVDIVSKECSKGNAVRIAQKILNIPYIAGIGDSYNDVPMLEQCDYSFTFHTSPEDVQKKATKVVESLAEAIETLMRMQDA